MHQSSTSLREYIPTEMVADEVHDISYLYRTRELWRQGRSGLFNSLECQKSFVLCSSKSQQSKGRQT